MTTRQTSTLYVRRFLMRDRAPGSPLPHVLAILLACGGSVAEADWCSGRQWLVFDMPLAQRIAEANSAVALELAHVERRVHALVNEAGFRRVQLAAGLDREMQSLTRQTQAECHAKASGPAEQALQRTQLRLDLGTLAALQDVERRLAQHTQEHDRLLQDLTVRRLELQHLHQRLTRLAEATPQPIEANLTLRGACDAVHASATLRGRYRPLSRDLLDQQVLEAHDALGRVPESDIDRVIETCDFGNLHAQVVPLAQGQTWWTFD